MGKGEAAHTKGAIIGFQAFLSTMSNLPRDAPGTRVPTTKSGQQEKAIPEVTGPGDIRRYSFSFPSFFCGKDFFFFFTS